jgi:hypothetical protein
MPGFRDVRNADGHGLRASAERDDLGGVSGREHRRHQLRHIPADAGCR